MSIIVTGATGLLGANFIHVALQAEKKPIGVALPCKWSKPPVPMRELDIRNGDAVRRMLEELRPEAVFHFAALTSVDWCESHPGETFALNAQASGTLAASAAEVGARFVYMSTDAVFDGKTGGYTESSVPSPINVYAASKLAGENEVLTAHPEALVVRTNIFGWNAMPKNNLAEWVLTSLRAQESIAGYTDSIFAPLLVNTLAEWMLALDDARIKGVVHVASETPLSKYDFAVALAETFGLSPTYIRPQLSEGSIVSGRALRPLNTALNGSSAARQLQKKQPSLKNMLAEFLALEAQGFVGKLRKEMGG